MTKCFKTKKISMGKVDINVTLAGSGKKTIVMVHGWTNNWIGLSLIAKRLAKKYQVVMVDLPGYGDSGWLGKYDIPIEAEFLKKVIKKMKLKEPYLLGHSMGTFVVSQCFYQDPEMVAGLILIGPVIGRKESGVAEKFFGGVKNRKRLVKWIKKGVDTKYYSYATSKFINMYKFDRNLIDKYGLIGKDKMDPQAYVDMGWSVAKTKMEDLIANNKVPIMLLFGKQDKITNKLRAELTLSGKGNYEYVEIDRAGHIVPVEKPKQTARAIDEWIEKVSSG